MHDYELVYILDPDLTEDAVNGLMERISTLATTQGAEIRNQERWEKRRLAYEINKKREGTYVVMEFHASAAAVHELDRVLKITEGILRQMIVRADEAVKAKAKGVSTAVETMAREPQAPTPQAEAPAVESPGPDITQADVPDVEPTDPAISGAQVTAESVEEPETEAAGANAAE
ncbi:MAG: 30S ribosomal protein S6 [Armatimonadetes bacterium]|nr:30S ribosomal protein S6 [Armatimonadota bacterium]